MIGNTELYCLLLKQRNIIVQFYFGFSLIQELCLELFYYNCLTMIN